jgi:hypothetical protein
MNDCFPSYDVDAVVFYGDPSRIYRARERSTGRNGMLKALRDEHAAREAAVLLKHEFEMARRLNVPGVIQVFDLERHNHLPYIVLEDFGGDSLDNLARRTRLPLKEVSALRNRSRNSRPCFQHRDEASGQNGRGSIPERPRPSGRPAALSGRTFPDRPYLLFSTGRARCFLPFPDPAASVRARRRNRSAAGQLRSRYRRWLPNDPGVGTFRHRQDLPGQGNLQPITERRGHFVSGKFDQLHHNMPYSALAAALRDLVRQLLTEPEEQLAVWRGRISKALGGNGQLMIDIIRELELIIGPQSAVPVIPPLEAEHRFHRAFQRFIQVFCGPDHPLAVFLEDLQWADSASTRRCTAPRPKVETGSVLDEVEKNRTGKND